MRLARSVAAAGFLVAIPASAGAAPLLDMPPDPQHIAGGTEVPECAYPAAVAMLRFGFPHCTGSLVHPRVVLYAAHCLGEFFEDPATEVGFGEDADNLDRIVPVDFCMANPGYDGAPGFEGEDVAFCVLAEPVDDVPIVPPLMGCEVEQLQPGGQVTIVGFGATYAEVGETEWENVMGVGDQARGAPARRRDRRRPAAPARHGDQRLPRATRAGPR